MSSKLQGGASGVATRRELFIFLMVLAVAGAVSRPCDAHGDETPIESETVELTVGQTKVPMLIARPQNKRSVPVVLVLHDISGIDNGLKGMCHRLARSGCMAVAPDLFVRQGDVTKMSRPEVIMKVLVVTRDAETLEDCAAAIAWAGEHGGDVERLGVCGMGWGGRVAWILAAHRKDCKCAVSWYGWLHHKPDGNGSRNLTCSW